MNASILGICRGEGLVYTKVVFDREALDDDIDVVVLADDGSSLPFFLYALNEGHDWQGSVKLARLADVVDGSTCEYALVTPFITEGGVTFLFRGHNCSKRFHFPAERIKWMSRLTYRLKPAIAGEIRDIDKRDPFDKINIKYDYLLPLDEKAHLVRGSVSFMQVEGDSELDIHLLDASGCALSARSMFVSDESHVAEADPNTIIRKRDFSIRIPLSASSGFTLLVICRSNPWMKGFLSVDEKDFDVLVEAGVQKTRDASCDPSYHDWFIRRRITETMLERQRKTAFNSSVMFSIVVPLYQTPLALLGDMVDSVRRQSYENWELILVDASEDNAAIRQTITELSREDSRIKTVLLDSNYGITENTNAGIDVCTGDYVCFLDHDDFLEPDALFEYAKVVENDNSVDLLYSDEDKFDENGLFFGPAFKPDFDLELLKTYNYVTHFLSVKKILLDKLERSTSIFDGAQDHNLILRAGEIAENIVHVPKILYHWRAIAGSTAKEDGTGVGAKEYAIRAGRTAIENHLIRMGLDARVEETDWPFVHRVEYTVAGSPMVSIVIPNKDSANLLEQCVGSIIEKTSYSNYEIVIVDNNSNTDEIESCYKRLMARDGCVRVVRWPGEFNFSKIVNYGVDNSVGEYVLLLNNDTKVISCDWIQSMLGQCQRRDVGAVGAKLYYEDGTIQHAGIVLVDDMLSPDHAYRGLTDACWRGVNKTELARQYCAVTGACLMVSKADYHLVGGFDETLAIAYNDVDFCLELRSRGLKIIYEPKAKLFHYESVTRGYDDASKDRRRRLVKEKLVLFAKWAEDYKFGDPFFNPNLETSLHKLDHRIVNV